MPVADRLVDRNGPHVKAAGGGGGAASTGGSASALSRSGALTAG